MITLKEAYLEYAKNDPHHTIIESQCIDAGCMGDIYRERIKTLENTVRVNYENYGFWQHRAERAELQLKAVIGVLRENMIFTPSDNWQWGYRSGLLAVLDVIKPEEK